MIKMKALYKTPELECCELISEDVLRISMGGSSTQANGENHENSLGDLLGSLADGSLWDD